MPSPTHGRTITLAYLGADISAVRSSFLKTQVTFRADKNLRIASADGSTIDSRGSCVLLVRLNKSLNFVPYQFVVIDNLSEDPILGEDFLRTYGAVIDIDNNTLLIKRQHYDPFFDPTPDKSHDKFNEITKEIPECNYSAEKVFAATSISNNPNTIARVRAKTEKSNTVKPV